MFSRRVKKNKYVRYTRKNSRGRYRPKVRSKSRTSSSSNKGFVWSIVIAGLIVLIVVFWMGSRYLDKQTIFIKRVPGMAKLALGAGQSSPHTGISSRVVVKVIKSRAKLHSSIFTMAGMVDAYTRTILVSLVNSKVSKVYGHVGGYFHQRDPIIAFEVDEKRYQLLQASSALNRAKLNFNAAQTLFSKNLYSYNQLLEAQGILHKAQAAFKMARLNLDHTVIYAPYDGILEQRKIDIGTPVAMGTVIGSFIQSNPLVAKMYVSQKNMQYVRLNQSATLISTNNQVKKGKIISIASSADPVTHTSEVSILFDNTHYVFHVGNAVTIYFQSTPQFSHFIPPSALVLNSQGLLGVMLFNHNIARFQNVSIQQETKYGVWVLGLPKYATIIVSGEDYLKSGTQVTTNIRTKLKNSRLNGIVSELKSNSLLKAGVKKIQKAFNKNNNTIKVEHSN